MQHLQHPMGPLHQIPPEDVFLSVDDGGTQTGMGYVICQVQPHLDPDCPINIYFSLECAPQVRFLLFGALVARARQLRDVNPSMKARIYTAIGPGETETASFYESSGLTLNHTEVMVRLNPLTREAYLPMGASIKEIPLFSPEEQMRLLSRFQQNDLKYLDAAYLQQMMNTPHFRAMGVVQNDRILAEGVTAGVGGKCELLALYVAQDVRRQGIAKVLLRQFMIVMMAEGVTDFTARIMTRSAPQSALTRAFAAEQLEVLTLFPELSI